MATIPAAPAGTVTYLDPQVEARDRLRATSPEALLDAAFALTHRIHEAERAPITCAREFGDYVDDLRAQRLMVRAELLRRMRGTR